MTYKFMLLGSDLRTGDAELDQAEDLIARSFRLFPADGRWAVWVL